MSYSIDMLSIQFDTKSLELVLQHQIVLFSKSCELEFYRCCTIIRHSRLLSFVGQSGKKRKNFVWNSGVVSTFTILV